MNILCFGDSNTWGYKPDKTGRFDENTRWTALLQKKLGPEYHIIEEGLCGRTTVFQDELRESRRGLDMIGVTVEMHNPLDLVIIMLGTNDCKTRYGASASVIARGLDQVVSRNLANEYRKVALQNHAAFLNAADFASPSTTDREHMDEVGHAALADAIYDKITALEKGLANVI